MLVWGYEQIGIGLFTNWIIWNSNGDRIEGSNERIVNIWLGTNFYDTKKDWNKSKYYLELYNLPRAKSKLLSYKDSYLKYKNN